MTIDRRVVVPALVVGGLAAASLLLINRNGGGVREESKPRRRRRAAEPTMVRVTPHGRKYHRRDCPTLHGGFTAIPMDEALESYEPCRTCHPPVPDEA